MQALFGHDPWPGASLALSGRLPFSASQRSSVPRAISRTVTGARRDSEPPRPVVHVQGDETGVAQGGAGHGPPGQLHCRAVAGICRIGSRTPAVDDRGRSAVDDVSGAGAVRRSVDLLPPGSWAGLSRRTPRTQHASTARIVTVVLTWWGHSTCTWQDRETTVLLDPVLTARVAHLRRVRGPVPPVRAAMADLVLISHLHADHAHLPSLRRIPRPRRCSLHRPARVGCWDRSPREARTYVNSHRVSLWICLGSGSLRWPPTMTAAGSREVSTARLPLGFLIEGSRRCWYPGDTGPRLALDQLGRIDLALVPVGGRGAVSGRGSPGCTAGGGSGLSTPAPSTLFRRIGERGGRSVFATDRT